MIVVLAIIALIATEKLGGTPLIDGDYAIDSTGKLKKDGKEYEVEISRTKPVGGKVVIANGQADKSNTTIDYTNYTVAYNDVVAEVVEKAEVAKLCALTDGEANTLGAKYTCDLGETEDTKGLVFYVLEAGINEKAASLIFKRNYDDSTQI